MAKKTYRRPTVKLYDSFTGNEVYVPMSDASYLLKRGYSLTPIVDNPQTPAAPTAQAAPQQPTNVQAPKAPAAPTAQQTANASVDVTGRQNSKPVAATDVQSNATQSTMPKANEVVKSQAKPQEQQPKTQPKSNAASTEPSKDFRNYIDGFESLVPHPAAGNPFAKTRTIEHRGRMVTVPIYNDKGKILQDDTMSKGYKELMRKTGRQVKDKVLSENKAKAELARINRLNQYRHMMAELDAREKEYARQLAELKKETKNQSYEGDEFAFGSYRDRFGILSPNYVGVGARSERGETEEQIPIIEQNLAEVRQLKKEVSTYKNDDAALKRLRAAFRGVGDKTNRRTWTFGIHDASEQKFIRRIINKINENKSLTKGDILILDSYFLNQETSNAYRDQLSGWYKAGEVTGESLPFMVEMMINSASGIGKNVAKAAAKKYLMNSAKKKLSRKAVEKMTEKQILRALTEEMGKKAVKRAALKASIPARVLGDAAGSVIMAETTGQARVMADALNRQTFEGEDIGTAYLKALGATAIENHSEMLGNYFSPIGGAIGRALTPARKFAGKWMARGAEKAGVGSVYQATKNFLTEVPKGELVKKTNSLLKKANWNGTFGEYAEEVLGNMENALIVGDMEFSTKEGKGVFNKDLNIETFNGVAFMSGMIGAAHMTADVTDMTFGPKWNAYKLKRNLQRAEQNLERNYGEKTNAVIQDLNMGEDSGRTRRIAKHLTEAAQQGPQKYYALLDYLKSLEMAKGGALGAERRRVEQSPQQSALDDTFDEATLSGTAEERKQITHDFNNAYTEAQNAVQGTALESYDWENAPLQALEQSGIDEGEAFHAVNAYAVARSAFDGMQERMADDIEVAAEDARDEAPMLVYSNENGQQEDFVRQATIAGRPVIVHSARGNYAMVRDMQTGQIFQADPKDIDEDSITDIPLDVFTELYAKAASEQMRAKFAAEIAPKEEMQEEVAETAEEAATEEEANTESQHISVPYPVEGERVAIYDNDTDSIFEGVIESVPEDGSVVIKDDEGTTRHYDADTYIQNVQQVAHRDGKVVFDRNIPQEDSSFDVSELEVGSQFEMNNTTLEVVKIYDTPDRKFYECKMVNPAEANVRVILSGAFEYWDKTTVYTTEENGVETWVLENDWVRLKTCTDFLHKEGIVSPEAKFEKTTDDVLFARFEDKEEDAANDKQTEEEGVYASAPAPERGQKVKIYIDGQIVEAEITNPNTENGTVLLMKTDGTGAVEFNPDIYALNVEQVADHYGKLIFDRYTKVKDTSSETQSEEAKTEPNTEEAKAEEAKPAANDKQTEVELTKPEAQWKEILDKTKGDAKMAEDVVRSMIEDKKQELKSEEKKKGKKTTTIDEKVAAAQEKKEKLDAIKAEIAYWEEVLKAHATYEQELKEQEQERLKAEAEAQRAEKERSRQTLDGVPEWEDDRAVDARNRGFRRTNGHKIERPGKVFGVAGKRVEVKFSKKVKQRGKTFVLEASQLQPSHYEGQRNPYHFLPDAQPKDRTEVDSVMDYQQMASQIRPEEITSSVTAYTGAPNVNERGEVIQGNNRSAALIHMWENHPEVAQRYKQYLIDHAKEFGFNAEDIAAMQQPILVNMLDVNDEQAITLGQYVSTDTESGGVERIKAKNVAGKMGADMSRFASILLSSSDEDASLSVLINANAIPALKWLQQKGYISATQYRSAFDKNGNVTAAAENDLKDILSEQLFHDAPEQIETAFNNLPAKAQRAILAVMHRDMASPFSEQMIKEVQASIMAFNELMQEGAFAEAKEFGEARSAIDLWKGQYRMDFFTYESYLPDNKYSNFALHLAAMYKTETQKFIQNTFNEMFDLIQGTKERHLFNSDTFDGAPKTLREAIKQVLNIDYNGHNGSNVLGKPDEAGQQGGRGSNQPSKPRGRTKSTTEQAQSQGGAKQNGVNPEPETAKPTGSERTQAPAKESAHVSEEQEADVAQEERGDDKTVREQFGSYKKGDKFLDDGPFGTGKVLTLSEFTGNENNPVAILHDEEGNVYKKPYSNIGTLLLPLNDNKKNTRNSSTSAEAKQKKADEENKRFGNFLNGKTPLQKATVVKTLSKTYNFGEEGIMTIAQFIEKHVADGTLKLKTKEVNKLQGPSRRQFNRMNAQEQAQAEERVKQAGKKTEYLINGFVLNQTAYEYAKFLSENERNNQQTAGSERTQAPAKESAPVSEEQEAEQDDSSPTSRKHKAEAEGEQETPTEKKKPIEDAGEKIGGARKDLVREFAERINLNGKTFAQIFPNINYRKLLEQGFDPHLLAGLKFIRETAKAYTKKKRNIPKGRDNSLNRIFFFANYAKGFLLGDTSVDYSNEGWTFSTYGKRLMEVNAEVYAKLYDEIGEDIFDIDLSGTSIDVIVKPEKLEPGEHSSRAGTKYYRDGKEINARYSPKINNRLIGHYAENEKEEAINALVEKVKKSIDYEKTHKHKLATYYKPGQPDSYYVGTKIGGKVVALTPEGSFAEYGAKYIREHNAELQAKAERIAEERKQQRKEKEKVATITKATRWNSENKRHEYIWVTTIGKETIPVSEAFATSDFENPQDAFKELDKQKDAAQAKAQELLDEYEARKGWKPEMNLGKLQSRVGVDYREGRNVSAQDMIDTFDFRGVEFGNYVTQKERQKYLNECYDAIMDMAAILNISPKAVSLNGKLGLAIGARGTGKAAAHYEPKKNVINLTKKSGAGTFAHEWWHAIDFYFGNEQNLMPATSANYGTEVREAVKDAIADLMKAINNSDYFKRSAALDKYTGRTYYATDTELAARAFQDYITQRLIERSQVNDFLSHHTAAEDWNGKPDTYPYPTDNDAKAIREAFGKVFDTIEEKQENGKAVLYHKAPAEAQAATTEDTALRDALADIMQQSGLEVFVDEKAQRVLDEENERVRLNAKQKRALETASLSQREKDHSTVVSSADGAKVLKNLDVLAKGLLEKSNRPKTFLGDVAKAIGAGSKGSSSQYATFETRNGKIVTIRLANHNASSKRMDDAGRDNAISIVVTNKPNDGIQDDGNAHVVEFYYNAFKLGRSVGHPLAEIVRSIKQALYSGEYKDTTGLAEIQEVNTTFGRLREHRVLTAPNGELTNLSVFQWEQVRSEQFKEWFGDWEDGDPDYASQVVDENGEPLVVYHGTNDDFSTFDRSFLGKMTDTNASDEAFARTAHVGFWFSTKQIPWVDKHMPVYLNFRNPLRFDSLEDVANELGETESVEAYLNNIKSEGYDSIIVETDEEYGGTSYVALDPNQIKSASENVGTFSRTQNDIRFFRTKNGQAYGFTVNGKIYLDPRIATAETAIHEYAHLWADMLRQMNPEAWNDIVQLMKGTSVWEEVKGLYPELKTEDEIADEVLAHYSGRRGAAKLREEQHRIAHNQNMDLRSKVTAIAALQRVKQALTKFWKGVADLLHIRFTTAEEVADRVLADLLHGVNPTAYAKRKDGMVRKQLIGEKGAANIDKAEEATTRLDNLNVAREMEGNGKDAKSIKLATGWERGADGKWRYEVMDGEFDSNGELHPERRELSAEEKKELNDSFDELMEAFEKGSLAYKGEIDEHTDMADIYEAGGMERKKAERIAYLEDKETELHMQPKTLEDYIANDALFAAYPELREVKVEEGDALSGLVGRLGNYNPKTNTITLNHVAYDVLLHEVQHAIQHIEGFAQGGNSNTYREHLSQLKPKHDVWSWVQEFKNKKEELGSEASQDDVYYDLINEFKEDGYEFGEDFMPTREVFDQAFDLWVRGTDTNGYEAAYNEYQRLTEKFGLGGKNNQYRHLAGEVESRNVQTRMNMTAEERRNSLAEETEDVAREDQIFIRDNAGKAEINTERKAFISPTDMSEEEKRERGEQLRNAPVVEVASNQIVKTEQLSARKAAEKWWNEHVHSPLSYQTEIGEVVIDLNSIGSSLAHRYGQAKLDAITSLKEGFENAVYLGSLKDFTRDGEVYNHYFAYPIQYNGERCYVLCRALHDANKNHLYVHEVFVSSKIEKGNTLQTAASQPHGGITLYKDILANVLDAANVTQTSDTANTLQRENAEAQAAHPANEADISEAANDAAKSLHLDNVTILGEQDLEGLTPKQRSAKGWFDPKTGRIYINASNHTNAADAI